MFFDSVDALVPRDSNGTVDVYEYEPPQSEGQPPSNDCSVPSPTYSAQSGGCVDLISSGTSPEESEFLDASEAGDDVFFLTGAQLVPADLDTALDIYDARVGGAVSEAVKRWRARRGVPGPVSAPEDPTPGSLTFQGPGNPLPPVSTPAKAGVKHLTRAQKLASALKLRVYKPKRKRAACERQARAVATVRWAMQRSRTRGATDEADHCDSGIAGSHRDGQPSWIVVFGARHGKMQSCEPWWHLTSSVRPAVLPSGGEGTIVIQASNIGNAPTSGPITVTATLPAGLSVVTQGAMPQSYFWPTLKTAPSEVLQRYWRRKSGNQRGDDHMHDQPIDQN